MQVEMVRLEAVSDALVNVKSRSQPTNAVVMRSATSAGSAGWTAHPDLPSTS
jgi:hypothetical protein